MTNMLVPIEPPMIINCIWRQVSFLLRPSTSSTVPRYSSSVVDTLCDATLLGGFSRDLGSVVCEFLKRLVSIIAIQPPQGRERERLH